MKVGGSEFEVFDRAQGWDVLDERAGMLVRSRGDLLEMNRPAVAAMCEVIGAKYSRSLQTRGVLLVFDPASLRAGLVVAPRECPPLRRQPVIVHEDPLMEWPLMVNARDFLAYWRLFPLLAQRRVELVDGVFVFGAQADQSADAQEERARLRRAHA